MTHNPTDTKPDALRYVLTAPGVKSTAQVNAAYARLAALEAVAEAARALVTGSPHSTADALTAIATTYAPADATPGVKDFQTACASLDRALARLDT
jgi:hypothetical protein